MAEISLTNVKLGVSNKTNYDAINNNFAELESKKLDIDEKAASAATADEATHATNADRATVADTATSATNAENANKVNNLTVETAVPANVVFFTNEEKEALLTEEEAKYSNETPIITAIGGIKVGETFDGLTIQEMFDKLLYPYVKPGAGITVTPNGGVFEKGTTQTVTSVKVTATKKSRNIKKVEAKKGSEVIKTIEDGSVTNGGSFECVTEPISITENISFSGIVTDTDNGQSTASGGNFVFVDPFFYGVVAPGAEVNSDLVIGLRKDISQKGNKTYTYTTNNQCMVIAYPASYGDLKTALDPNKFENIGSYTKSTVDVNVTSGTVSYNVYVKEASTAENFKISYSF